MRFGEELDVGDEGRGTIGSDCLVDWEGRATPHRDARSQGSWRKDHHSEIYQVFRFSWGVQLVISR